MSMTLSSFLIQGLHISSFLKKMKLGIHDFEMGEGILADDTFKGQKVNITPLIEKLHLHMQG